MKRIILIISALYICTQILAQQEITYMIEHDGKNRNFILYIPSSYDNSNKSFPLVFNFHGFTSSAAQQKGYSAMNNVAEENDFLICYPNGIDNAWNVNWNFGSSEDDLGFTEAMIDTLLNDYEINPGKIYACGMSNGGFFSYWLACNLSETFAAVASVTGSFSPQMMTDCNPTRKIPVMQIHGTDDMVVPYDGFAGTAEPIEDVIDFWLNHNICSENFEFTQFDDTNPNDNSTVSQEYYKDCEDEAEVLFVKIDGGGHTWPSSPVILPGTNLDYNASEKIWEFFDRHQIDALSFVKNEELEPIKLFPNPIFDKLNIEGQFEMIQITNQLGKTLLSSTSNTIQLGHLPIGVYFATVYHKDRKITHKLIKTGF